MSTGRQIFVCNGAVEESRRRFIASQVPESGHLPTFSPYYEYLRPDQECFTYKLSRDADFALDVDDFIDFVLTNRIDTVCLINPNNPNGGYIPSDSMQRLLEAFENLQLVILDESFIDFAYEDEQRSRRTLVTRAATLPNVMLVKSMSRISEWPGFAQATRS